MRFFFQELIKLGLMLRHFALRMIALQINLYSIMLKRMGSKSK